jgi:hypothetical protein
MLLLFNKALGIPFPDFAAACKILVVPMNIDIGDRANIDVVQIVTLALSRMYNLGPLYV